MSFSSNQLRFLDVLQSNYSGLLCGDPERDEWAMREAEELQARMVADSVRETSFQAVVLADDDLPEEAVFHLRYGLAKRLKIIWVSLRRILENSPPGQTAPLSIETVEHLESDLNSLYVNLRGALDNVAWSICALHPSVPVQKLAEGSVDLFGERFRATVCNDELKALIEPFRA